MIFCLAALVILGMEVFWRTACEQAAEPPGVGPVLSSQIAYWGRSRLRRSPRIKRWAKTSRKGFRRSLHPIACIAVGGRRGRRAARSAECGTPRRSGFGRLRLRSRLGSVVVGSRRRPFLLSLQLFVVSCLFGAVALGTLKAIIRFTHQQDSWRLAARREATLVILCGGLALFSIRGVSWPSGGPLDQ
jgi:hypothetical protein